MPDGHRKPFAILGLEPKMVIRIVLSAMARDPKSGEAGVFRIERVYHHREGVRQIGKDLQSERSLSDALKGDLVIESGEAWLRLWVTQKTSLEWTCQLDIKANA